MNIETLFKEDLRNSNNTNIKSQRGYYTPKIRINILNKTSSTERQLNAKTNYPSSSKTCRNQLMFIPFINERDHLGKLIKINENHDDKRAITNNIKKRDVENLVKQQQRIAALDFINHDFPKLLWDRNHSSPKLNISIKIENFHPQSVNNSLIHSPNHPLFEQQPNSTRCGTFGRNSICNSDIGSDKLSIGKFDFEKFKFKPVIKTRNLKHFLSPKNHKSPCFLSTPREEIYPLVDKRHDTPFGLYETPSGFNNKAYHFSKSPKTKKDSNISIGSDASKFNYHEAYDKLHQRKISVPNFSTKIEPLSLKHANHEHMCLGEENACEELYLDRPLFRKNSMKKDMKEVQRRLKLEYQVKDKNLPIDFLTLEDKFKESKLKYNIPTKNPYFNDLLSSHSLIAQSSLPNIYIIWKKILHLGMSIDINVNGLG